VDKIVQIHEDRVTTLLMAPGRNFIATASLNGFLRLWSPDFSKLISEVNTQQRVLSCDVNAREICVLGMEGTLSLLDLEESTFSVCMRSHLDHVSDLCFNGPAQRLITIGLDQRIYIWNAETLEVLTEFVTQNDAATRLASSVHDATLSVGFRSGFIRIFDLNSGEAQGKLVAETMIFESPVMDIQYSLDNRFMAVFYKSCRIVIFSVEKGY
jgi:WD40 repeat protein